MLDAARRRCETRSSSTQRGSCGTSNGLPCAVRNEARGLATTRAEEEEEEEEEDEEDEEEEEKDKDKDAATWCRTTPRDMPWGNIASRSTLNTSSRP